MGRRIKIYDTTLTDSEQWSDVALTPIEKIVFASRLDQLGMAYIEVGDPSSSAADLEFYQLLAQASFDHARPAVFGIVRADASEDANEEVLKSMLAASTPVCTVMAEAGGTHAEDFLQDIETSIEGLVNAGREVIFNAGNFFAGFKEDPALALQFLQAALRGGAQAIVLCDPGEETLPWETAQTLHLVRSQFSKAVLGVHMSDPGTGGVANAVAAIGQGAALIQGSINGYGGRAGRANLSNIIPDLELKMGYTCLMEGRLPDLLEVSQYLADLSLQGRDAHMPYVGRSNFVPI